MKTLPYGRPPMKSRLRPECATRARPHDDHADQKATDDRPVEPRQSNHIGLPSLSAGHPQALHILHAPLHTVRPTRPIGKTAGS